MNTYWPRPIETAGISLDLNPALVERLAEHNHDTWAQRRMDEGWTWGPRVDNEKMTHPCLIPFARLPQSEQDYDRQTVVAILKAAVALGVRVEAG
jgi:hypothetical protein